MNKETFENILSSYIARERELIEEHDEIAAILKPLEGKQINGITLNKKRLGKFRFKEQYAMYYIIGKAEHLIGVTQENYISVEKTDYSRGFEYFDSCCGDDARGRIKKIEQTDKEKAYLLFNRIEYHFTALRNLFGQIETEKLGSFDFPVYYDLLKSIYSGDDVKLTNFYFIRREGQE